MRAVIVESRDAAPHLVEDADEALLEGTDPIEQPVEIDVLASSLNYKDGMALAGRGILRAHPLIPGIDLVGTVTASASDRFRPGDQVVLNGDGIGERVHGGFATRARVRPDALVHLPAAFTPAQAAAIGTAGFTAMLAVQRLEDAGVAPEGGEVLVTGASGGAGSIAVALLAGRGFEVVASTGRVDESTDYLRSLGAARVIDRAQLADGPAKPLGSQQWAAAIDGVGSKTLAAVLAGTRWGGTVAAYGLAQGPDLPATVLPFILRHVTLAGVNSVDAPLALRERAWTALAAELDTGILESMTRTIGLAQVLPEAERILAGQVRGRTVVDVTA